MRIGIISPAYEIGGASMVATYMGEAFAKMGHDVFFVAHNSSEKPKSINRFYSLYKKKMAVEGINRIKKILEFITHEQNFTPSKYVNEEIKLLREVLNKEKPQIIIFNTFIPMVLFTRFLRKEFPKVKLITWMHSDPDYSMKKIAVNYIDEYKKNFHNVDAIVCLSEEAKNALKIYNNETRIIYNPLIIENGQVSDLTEKVISFTSRYDICVKGFDYLCKIANDLPNEWSIRVAGDGSKNQKKELQELIKKNNAEKKIILAGNLFGEKLINHYLESSIFISTSRTEGLPLAMIEAISYGLPVISFDHTGGKEILGDGIYGILVERYNVTQFNKSINDLVNNKDMLKKYQKYSLTRSSAFRLDSIIEQWNALFKVLGAEENK